MSTLMIGRRDQNETWDKFINKALKAQRTRRNRATGETPAMALLGYEIALPGQWEIPEFKQQRRTQREETAHRRRQIVERQLNFNQRTYPDQDQPQETTFRVGDAVMVKNLAATDPFAPAWTGPHPVMEVLSDQMYEVDRNGRQANYHIDQLRKAPADVYPDEECDENPPSEEEEENADYHESASRTDRSVHRPAETDVDHGPSTSGQPVYRLRSVTEERYKINCETRLRRLPQRRRAAKAEIITERGRPPESGQRPE